MLHLTTSGTPRERGRQHGETLRVPIAELLETWAPAPLADDGWCVAHWLHEFQTDTFEELAGIAEGAAQPEERILALTIFNSLAVVVAQGCTTLIARGRDSGGVLGKTQDVGPVEGRFQLVQHLTDEVGRQAVVVGLAGTTWAVCGLNDSGLAAGINSASPVAGRARLEALPQHQALYRLLKHEATVQGALRAWLRTPLVGKGITGCLCDALGDAVSFERAGTRYAVTSSTGSLHHVNHYRDPGMAAMATTPPAEHSLRREAALTERLAGRWFDDPLAEARDVLAATPVCSPLDAEGIGTWSAFLADPATRTFHVCDGSPAAAEWTTISLG